VVCATSSYSRLGFPESVLLYLYINTREEERERDVTMYGMRFKASLKAGAPKGTKELLFADDGRVSGWS